MTTAATPAAAATAPASTTTPAAVAALPPTVAGTTSAAQTTKPVETATTPATPVDPVTTTPAPTLDPRAAEKLRLLRNNAAQTAENTQIAELQKANAKFVEAFKSKDLVKILQAGGMSSDEIAKFMLNGAGGKADPKPEVKTEPKTEAATDPKASALEEKLSETTRVVEELRAAEKARTDAARKVEEQEARNEVVNILAESKDALPWVNALGQADTVIAEMQAAAKRGETPDFDASAKAVETRLAAQMPAYLARLLQIPAARALVEAELVKVGKPAVAPAAATTAPTAPGEKKDEDPLSIGALWRRAEKKTITNDLDQRGAAPKKPQTPDEIWNELINRPKSP